jgi:hypothetical protein
MEKCIFKWSLVRGYTFYLAGSMFNFPNAVILYTCRVSELTVVRICFSIWSTHWIVWNTRPSRADSTITTNTPWLTINFFTNKLLATMYIWTSLVWDWNKIKYSLKYPIHNLYYFASHSIFVYLYKCFWRQRFWSVYNEQCYIAYHID